MDDRDQIRESFSNIELKTLLGDDADGMNLYVFDELDSTNTYAKRLVIEENIKHALIVAGFQSAGRGRMGRSFYSPNGTGVYFSILHTTEQPLSGVVSLTSMTAVAVMRAIRDLTGKQAQIKWVNDLYLQNKKVCGILAESISLGEGMSRVIIGIGINWYASEFPQELAQIAGSVGADRSISRLRLVAQIHRELQRLMRSIDSDDWLSDYREHSMVIGKEILWMQDGREHTGRAIGIDPRGALIVRNDAGEETALFSGEITLRVR